MIKVAIVVSHPIQHFCPQYSSWAQLGGVELRVFFASNHGIVPYEDRKFQRTIHWEGILLDFPHTFLSGADKKTVNTKIDAQDLESQLVSFAPDLLIVYGYAQKLQRRALKWATRNQVYVAMISDAELRTQRPFIKKLVKSFVLPRYLRKIDYFLTVGDANEAYYRHYGATDNQFVRCFFPIDRRQYDAVLVDKENARNKVRGSLNIPEHHRVIFNVGKFVPWKRQKDLVNFSNTIQELNDDITIILAGTGPDDVTLRKICNCQGPGGVIFAGFIPPDELISYYCASDVYIQCSEHEPHSLAISEAIYCGLPAVISDRCGSYGPSDDVRQGLNGFIYECSNIKDLSNKIFAIIGNKKLQKKFSVCSQQISRHHQSLAHGEALSQINTLLNNKKNNY